MATLGLSGLAKNRNNLLTRRVRLQGHNWNLLGTWFNVIRRKGQTWNVAERHLGERFVQGTSILSASMLYLQGQTLSIGPSYPLPKPSRASFSSSSGFWPRKIRYLSLGLWYHEPTVKIPAACFLQRPLPHVLDKQLDPTFALLLFPSSESAELQRVVQYGGKNCLTHLVAPLRQWNLSLWIVLEAQIIHIGRSWSCIQQQEELGAGHCMISLFS